MNLITRAIAWLRDNEPVVALNAVAGIITTAALVVRGVADQVEPGTAGSRSRGPL